MPWLLLMLHALYTILLIEGFVTISVEILAIRQLLPFFGGSVLTTSLIIGIFLLFLAVGYWRGGQHQTDFIRKLRHNFSYAFIWIGFGLSYFVLTLYFYSAMTILHFGVLLSLLGYLLCIIAPIVYWLGQTIPLTTNLFNQSLRIAHISGRALFISTLGSFLGAVLTTLLFFQYFGVAWTIVFNGILLLLLIVYLSFHQKISWVYLVFFGILSFFITFLNVFVEKSLFVKTNNYANYEVVPIDPFARIFKINGSSSSLLTAKNKGFAYIEYIHNFLFQKLNLRNKKLLVIGAGGFSLTADGTYQNTITYIDLDPDIQEIAENTFLKKAIQGQFIGQDARSFLLHNNEQFDVIFSDAYSNAATIPQALLTKEYFQSIASRLKPQGLFIANIIANPFLADTYSQSVDKTIREVFSFCMIIPIDWTKPVANILYICPRVSDTGAIYSDDKSKATTDFWLLRNE